MRFHEENTIIRFEDADPAGVIFYPRALALAHTAVEQMIRRGPLGWDTWFASPQYAAPLRRAEADFFHPLRAGTEVAVCAAVEKCGETSVSFLVELRDANHRVAATIRTVHVLIDKRTGRPVALPEEMRQAFTT